MPDKRTVAFPPGKAISAYADGQNIQRPHFAWDKDWKRVEHGLIAVALDNRWAHGLSKEDIGCEEPVWTSLAQNAATMVAGLDWKNGLDLHAYLTGKDRSAGKQMVKDIKALLKEVPCDAERDAKELPEAERKAVAVYLQMYKDLAQHMHIRQHESAVRLHTKAKVNLADLVKSFFGGPTAIIHQK